jgi:hypothetical protein
MSCPSNWASRRMTRERCHLVIIEAIKSSQQSVGSKWKETAVQWMHRTPGITWTRPAMTSFQIGILRRVSRSSTYSTSFTFRSTRRSYPITTPSRANTMSTQFSSPASSGMSSTIQQLYNGSPPSSLTSSGQQPWLVAPQGSSLPNGEASKFLQRLVKSAHDTSESLLAGSILAGSASETDEFSDVAVWLPDGSTILQPTKVLETLGLQSWSLDARQPLTCFSFAC